MVEKNPTSKEEKKAPIIELCGCVFENNKLTSCPEHTNSTTEEIRFRYTLLKQRKLHNHYVFVTPSGVSIA